MKSKFTIFSRASAFGSGGASEATGIPAVIVCALFAISSHSFGATITGDFTGSNSTTVGGGWTEVETVAAGAQITSNQLQVGSTTGGREWVYQTPTTVFSTLSSETNIIEWSFNMRTTRTDPSGFDASNYGLAFVLATTSTDITSGNGYAVALGNSTSTDPLRLVSFTGGMDANSNTTNIISSGDFGAEYLNIRVTFDPSGNNWSLYGTSSATAFSDPSAVTAQLGSTTANSTYTSSTMNAFGALWNHATGASENAIFDNVTLKDVITATSLYWLGDDSTRGGVGTWSSAGTTWSATDADGPPVASDKTKTAIFGGPTAGAVAVSGTVEADNGITFNTTGYTLSGGTAIEMDGASASVNAISVATAMTATITMGITGTTGFTKTGAGTLILGSSNGVSGAVSVGAGTLELASAGALGSATSLSIAGTFLLSGSAGNRINDTAAVSVTSGGLFNLSGLSETIGALNITSGASAATVGTGAGILTVGGNIAATGGTSNAAAITGNLDLGAATRTITVTNGAVTIDLDLGATVISNGGIILSGSTSGTRTDISGASTFAGGATLNSGLLVLGSSSDGTPASFTTGPLGTGTVTLAGGTLQAANSTRTLNNAVLVTGNFGTASAGTQTVVLAGSVDLNGGTRTLDVANSNGTSGLTLSGAVSNGGIIKIGGGLLTLSGDNSYSGVTTVSAGTLRTGASNALPSGTAVTVGLSGATANRGILDLNGTSQTIASLTLRGSTTNGFGGLVTIGSGGILTVNGNVNFETSATGGYYPGSITGGTLNLGGATRTFEIYNHNNSSFGGDLDVTSVVANGGINKTQEGILTLSGANTFGGATTLSAGTLNLNNANALQNSTLDTGTSGTQAVTFANSSTTYNLGGLSGTDALAIVSGGRISVGSNSADTTYSGVLSGITATSGLSKTGTGKLTLSGDNSYDGTTVVSAGTLEINGNQSTANGTVTVSNSGTTLSGTGTIGGATTIQAGAIHAPGNSPGIQKFTSSLTYADASIFSWEIDRTAAQTRGTGYDAVNVTGTLTGLDGADAGTTFNSIFRIVIGDSNFSNPFWNDTRTWSDIFTAANGMTVVSNWASIFGGGFEYYNSAGSISAPDALNRGGFSITGSTLTWTAVPEPTSALVGLLITAGLMRRRRVA